MSGEIPFLYINGVSDGSENVIEKLAMWWWRKHGHILHHAHINWVGGASYEKLYAQAEKQALSLLRQYGRLAIIGSSAGASLGVAILYKNPDEAICFINSRGRLADGDLPDWRPSSLKHRTKKSAAFLQSIKNAEKVIENHASTIAENSLVLTQLTDMVVPKHTMEIPGAAYHRSLTFGHKLGFLAHMFANRKRIVNFTKAV